MRYLTSIAILLLACAVVRAEYVSFEKASSNLQSATVTVRVIPAKRAVDDIVAEEAEAQVARQVSVCSGASVGEGLIITYAEISAQDEVRITIPGGQQAKAELKVVDHISGLTLLETDQPDVPKLTAAKEIPGVGAWVLAGAGWGSEKPVVSFGILAGANRTIHGATFPPLLQCDLRTADTSNGAPLVNQEGELIGIIVASDAGGNENRWTYAVPVKHVQRLLRARRPDQVIEIKKVRPVVGMHLDLGPTPNSVVVRRVAQGGPADKAGIQVGDQILLAEGTSIRSPYQVIAPLLAKQPGETMKFTLQQGDERRELEIVLGGGTVLQPKPSFSNVAGLKPAGTVGLSRVFLSAKGPAKEEIVIRRSNAQGDATDPQQVAQDINQLQLQHKAITTYLSALQSMQNKLKTQQQAIEARDAEIEALRRQLQTLQETNGR